MTTERNDSKGAVSVATSFLEWLGRDRLALMGYIPDVLNPDLDQEPLSVGSLLSDCFVLAKQLSGAVLQSNLNRPSEVRRSGDTPDVIFD